MCIYILRKLSPQTGKIYRCEDSNILFSNCIFLPGKRNTFQSNFPCTVIIDTILLNTRSFQKCLLF